MATSQLVREQVVNKTQSLAVVKNMVRTSVSEICYLRGLFDDDCFVDKRYADVKIKALCPVDRKAGSDADEAESVVKNEEAWKLTRWLEEGVFDAVEKSYLKSMVFAIYGGCSRAGADEGGHDLLECYVYKFTYPNADTVQLNITRHGASVYSTDAVRKQAVNMVRSLIAMCNTLAPLPDERYMTIRLYYYDDITPPEYQPKFFVDASSDGPMRFRSAPVRVELGNIDTPNHGLTLRVSTAEAIKASEAAASDECETDPDVATPDEHDCRQFTGPLPPGSQGPPSSATERRSHTQPITSAKAAPESSHSERGPRSEQPAAPASGVEVTGDQVDDVRKFVVSAPRYPTMSRVRREFPDLSLDQVREAFTALCGQGVMRYSPKARRYVVCSTSCEAGSSTATGAAPTASTAAAGTDAVDDDLDASTIYRLALCYVHSRKLAHVTIRQLSHGIDVAHEVAREALNRMERDGFLTAPERNLRRGRQVVRNAKTLVLFQQAVDFVRSRGLDQRLMEQAMDGMTLAMASGSAASRVKPARAAADAAAKADTARRYGIDTPSSIPPLPPTPHATGSVPASTSAARKRVYGPVGAPATRHEAPLPLPPEQPLRATRKRQQLEEFALSQDSVAGQPAGPRCSTAASPIQQVKRARRA